MAHPKKAHLLPWAIVIIAGNLPFYELMPMYKAIQWLELLWHISSVISLFYISAHIMKLYYNTRSPYRQKQRWIIANRHILSLLAAIAIYVAISTLLERQFFGRSWPIKLHIYKRLSIIASYVVAGMYLARSEWRDEKKDTVLRVIKGQRDGWKGQYVKIKELMDRLNRG